MADLKISELTNLTAADPANDMIPIVDVSATPPASGSTKRISINNILACSPSATLASASITGDLTVDTSTLKVDSANNRVGVLNAAPNDTFTIASDNYLSFQTASTGFNSGRAARIGAISAGSGNGYLVFETYQGGSGGAERYRIASDGVATWSNVGGSSGTAMTLNSTGLGVGRSPISKLTVDKASQTPGGTTPNGALVITDTVGSNLALEFGVNSAALPWIQSRNSTTGTYYDLLLNPNGGNVGIGVTPSAGKGCLQLSSGINFPATQVASSDANTLDDYEEGTFTPTIVGTTGAGTGTYTTQLGRYTKVGRIVTCDISLVWTAHDGTGNIDIGGLPFSVLNTTGYAASAVIGYIDNIALTAGNIPIAVLWWFNTTKIRLNQTPTGGGAAAGVPMDSAGQINLSITYIVA